MLRSNSFVHGSISKENRAFSHDVTAVNNEMAATLMYQTNPVRVELPFYAKDFFCFNKFA